MWDQGYNMELIWLTVMVWAGLATETNDTYIQDLFSSLGMLSTAYWSVNLTSFQMQETLLNASLRVLKRIGKGRLPHKEVGPH